VAELVAKTGAKLAWIPRRAGERGALDAGLLPIDGRNTSEIVSAAGSAIRGLVVGGVSPEDIDGDLMVAISKAQFVVSLETRHTEITAEADVVLPVAVVTEKAGTFRNWEGRDRSFPAVTPNPGALSDADVLGELARELGKSISVSDFWATANKPALKADSFETETVGNGQAILSTWRHVLDKGSLQSGEPYLAATARVAVIRVSPATAKQLNLIDGATATVSCCGDSANAPLIVTAAMADGVVWLPANSEGSSLNLPSGCVVDVSQGGN
jgi:NADH-quinone oxidoreductase subunit G